MAVTWIDLLRTFYLLSCLGIIGFQVALICGAPWGRVTQGGGHEGPLPLTGRIVAFTSIFILIGMACAIASAAGGWPHWPAWTGWVALAVQFVSTVLNWITPSVPERRLWGPIMLVLLIVAATLVLSA